MIAKHVLVHRHVEGAELRGILLDFVARFGACWDERPHSRCWRDPRPRPPPLHAGRVSGALSHPDDVAAYARATNDNATGLSGYQLPHHARRWAARFPGVSGRAEFVLTGSFCATSAGCRCYRSRVENNAAPPSGADRSRQLPVCVASKETHHRAYK